MKRVLSLGVAIVALAVFTSDGHAQGQSIDRRPARVTRANRGAALSLPSTASPRAVFVQFLRDQGRDTTTTNSLAAVSEGRTTQGLRAAQFEQRVGGLRVFGAYAKIALTARGELTSVIENLVTVRGSVRAARVSETQAVRAAIRNLYPALAATAVGFFHRNPSAERVAIAEADGSLSAGFLVETWTQETNQLHYTLVGGDGAIRDVESRTNTDAYKVFRKDPITTPQGVVQGPGAGNAESPAGWLLAGAQRSTNITGNNVKAYLDVVSDNRVDAGGTAITNGRFVATATLDQSPSTTGNRAVAVQNLFYLNNVLHDELYRHGFTEGVGNFQENNFGGGGKDSDSVNAEAQDGGGIDNANFATPTDGSNPRMQMYLWTGKGTHEVVVNNTSYRAQGAEFGPALDASGLNGVLAVANDGVGTTSDACEAIAAGSLNGKVAIVDRGTCDFVVKVKNAQNAGAVAAIVANNRNGTSILTMGGTDASITIPSVFVGQFDGATLKAAGAVSATVRLKDPAPLHRDGDVDSDIVFHEYCHGLTWRMIGRMSGPLAGAIGEGMSDVCAVMMNENDVVGEYSFDDPLGLRRFPYANYPLTYGDITGAEVHADGELYGAIGWQLLQNFGTARKDALFTYMVDGMNFTPAQPSYEQMRDGILQAADSADECLVWQAFAKYGVGVGATGVATGKSVSIAESFVLPANCQP